MSGVPDGWGGMHKHARRDRLRYECPVCRLCVEMQGDRLNPILDALRGKGIARVSLSGLTAIVT